MQFWQLHETWTIFWTKKINVTLNIRFALITESWTGGWGGVCELVGGVCFSMEGWKFQNICWSTAPVSSWFCSDTKQTQKSYVKYEQRIKLGNLKPAHTSWVMFINGNMEEPEKHVFNCLHNSFFFLCPVYSPPPLFLLCTYAGRSRLSDRWELNKCICWSWRILHPWDFIYLPHIQGSSSLFYCPT